MDTLRHHGLRIGEFEPGPENTIADAGLRALRCPEAGLAEITAQGRDLADRLAREVGADAVV